MTNKQTADSNDDYCCICGEIIADDDLCSVILIGDDAKIAHDRCAEDIEPVEE